MSIPPNTQRTAASNRTRMTRMRRISADQTTIRSAKIRSICVIRVLFFFASFPLIAKDLSSKLRLGSEVQQQAHFDVRGLQVIQTLGAMDIVQCVHRFQLDQYGTLDQKVGGIVPDDHSVVAHDDGVLLQDMQTSLPELVRQRSLVNFFEKSSHERVLNTEGCADTALGQAV